MRPFKARQRNAFTLIEVIFSIGVILIGLLGVASILPLAGRRAQDAVSLSVGSSICDSVLNELQSRKFLADGRFLLLDDNMTFDRDTLSSLTPVSFCIDPLFVADFDANNTIPVADPGNRYSHRFFPYYQATHDPTQDPSTAYTELWPSAQPRLHRVGITRTGVSFNESISVEEAFSLVDSADDLAFLRPDDKSLSAVLKGSNAVSSGSPYGKQLATGEYTWFATVNPMPGDAFASISVVVVRNRNRSFAVPTTTTAMTRPDLNMSGERLAYVTYSTGFRGGAGGVVHLASSANTISSLKTNDWLMLSRRTTSGVDVHRWYRVSAVDGDAAKENRSTAAQATNPTLAALPGTGTRDIWTRKIYLDGPDWSFGIGTTALPAGYSDDTFADNTFATLVSDVVSVTERVVSLNSL
jgi:type II secretory pathway pseudopilin PulG